MSINTSFLEYIGIISYNNENERLAAKRLEYMKNESYWAEKRRAVERELVEYNVLYPPPKTKQQ